MEEGVRGVTEENEERRFDPLGFALVGTFFVFSAASFVSPGYAGVGDPWRWIIYVIGIVSFLLGCLGFTVTVGNAYGGTEGFLLSVYVLSLFTLATVLHLATVYIPMTNGLVTAARIVAYLLVLPWSLLMLLGVFRVIEGLSTPKHRTDAILTILALLGALLPLLASLLFGTP